MKSFWTSLRFLAASQLKLRAERNLQVRTYSTSAGPVVCDVYRPAKSRGKIVTINGFAPLGSRDPRIISVNEALVYAGFTVVSPTIPEICEYKIDPGHVRLFDTLLRDIASDTGPGEDNSVSVLAPSFSGSLSMLAAFRSPDPSHLRAVCMIGSYADAEATLGTVFLDPKVDEYGRLILLKNFIHRSVGRLPGMQKALRALLHDNYFQPAVPSYPVHEASLQPSTRRMLQRLRTQETFRAAQWRKILSGASRARTTLSKLCLLKNARPVRTAVTLIHGQEDSVVLSEQSRILHRALLGHGINSSLVITPLISHGDSQITIGQAPALLDLCRGFAHFFRFAEAS
jgi:pimeloyl-ACP methyl ester carboxylesterase